MGVRVTPGAYARDIRDVAIEKSGDIAAAAKGLAAVDIVGGLGSILKSTGELAANTHEQDLHIAALGIGGARHRVERA